MRFHFMLTPAAVVAVLGSSVATADTFLSVQEAQQLIFPDAQFTAADFTLSESEVEKLRDVSRATVFRAKVKMWSVSTGGWFFLDQVLGRDDRLTYAVGVNADGTLRSIEILECTGEYGQVRSAEWRRNFSGKRFQRVHLGKEIPNISGATLSAAHIADGVTRVLATYELFVASKAS